MFLMKGILTLLLHAKCALHQLNIHNSSISNFSCSSIDTEKPMKIDTVTESSSIIPVVVNISNINSNNSLTQSEQTPALDYFETKRLFNIALFNFSINYSTVMFEHYGNIAMSPISLSKLMFLTSFGASDSSHKAMDITYTLPALRAIVRKNITSIKRIIGKNSIANSEMMIAHNIFVPTNIELSEKFSNLMRCFFKCYLQQINFTDYEQAASEINIWSAQQTNNNINDVVNPDQFNNETGLVLISVAFFNSSWLNPFYHNKTKKMEFYVNGNNKKVWMMNQVINCRYGILTSRNDSTFVELPLKIKIDNYRTRMIIILPHTEKNLSNVVSSLREFKLDDISSHEKKKVNIFLPRFQIKSKINLKEHQKEMGIDIIFSREANFNSITKSQKLKVSDFIQMTVINVDEGNNRLKSQSGFGINQWSSSPNLIDFYVNRPFIVLIVKKDEILASAQVVDPNS